MKTARELFEELGYTCEKSNGVVITYRYYTANKGTYTLEIDFWFDLKKYYAFENSGGLSIESSIESCNYQTMGIDMPTFKAIQKQLEELGWLE